ncbi:TonB-dependent receptor [uncultured Croceicoccus sp.]|uniref:TonB-dependent receptor domain-containing protein n=1 Tax=uncultured Croceicoccus sp. TaxID=1295329 RepID=UPI002607D0B3|nr:TonB-dependent receptor [uncultured Croceicoccus sp.]
MKFKTNSMLKASSSLRAAALVGATSLLAVASPAFAQADMDEPGVGSPSNSYDEQVGQPIVVTGSRIARRNLETAAPVAVVNEEEFELSGSVNVESVINALPQVVPGLNGNSNNPGNGAATLNLRGLGETRTMVLVNGRRWMFYDTSQIVDLNTIPQFLIQNVDVVTGGASAVYGSDALAGVVNFKLRDDLDGILLGGQSSITERGDGHRYNIDIALGSDLADGRGNVTVWGSYNRRKEIFQDQRAFSRFAAVDGCIVPGSIDGDTGISDQTVPFSSSAGQTCVGQGGVIGPVAGGSSGVPTTYVDALGAQFANSGGTLVDYSPFNYAPFNYLQLPQERYMLGGYGHYDIADGMTAYTELSYVNSNVPQELAPTPAFLTVDLDVDSPFFDQSVQNQLAALDTDGDGFVSSQVRRRLLELGSRNSNDDRNAFRVLGGLRGEFSPAWGYDAYYMYSRTRNSQIQSGNASISRFTQALRTEFDDDGNLVCTNPANGCVPLNIFGLNTISDEAADFIRIGAQNTEISSLQVANATINGELFELQGGALGVAFGAEYRKVSSEYIPDTFLASGDVTGFNAGLPTEGSYDVKELFGELYVPLINGGFIDRLELTGAVRYSDYSLGAVGGVWTYAGGVTLAPIRDITLRGQYQRAVRAPNVDELFGGASQGFPPATDPCSSRSTNQSDAVRDLCIATGVPADAVFTDAVQLNSQIEGQFGGNPNLEEETADTFTAGVVLQPSFIPRLAITVDYFDIKVENLISTLGGGLNNALSLCYNTVQDVSSEYCQAINRFDDGSINFVEILNANISELTTSGVDLEVSYATPVGFSMFGAGESDLSFYFLGTWTDENTFTPVSDLPDQTEQCAGYYGSTCGTLQPEYKFSSRVTLSDGPATISLRGRYVGEAEDDQLRDGVDAASLAIPRLKETFYLDLATSFEVLENKVITFGVNNLLDQQPRLTGDSQQQANTYPTVYDVLGRDFFVSFKAEF